MNKKLTDKYGMKCRTNAETFDRDMPIRFLPIKFEKLRLRLEAAGKAGYDKAITFEFSHFMSPQSSYLQAGHLYDRYKEYMKTLKQAGIMGNGKQKIHLWKAGICKKQTSYVPLPLSSC